MLSWYVQYEGRAIGGCSVADSLKALDIYHEWCNRCDMPQDLKAELLRLSGDDATIVDRFSELLDFGTGGLRSVMGAGLNRMNIYTIRSATFALAEHIKAEKAAPSSVVIGYDCRHKSRLFAIVAGCVLAAADIKAYVAPVLSPTPELSFAVRALQCDAGIMITASHNPPAYNGYKVYNEDGSQLLEAAANDIQSRMAAIADVFSVPTMPQARAEQSGLLLNIPADIRTDYIEQVVVNVQDNRLTPAHRGDVRVVYTPLHGTGFILVKETLRAAGYTGVHIVPEQARPDGDFSTVKSPNPEEPEALEIAIRQAADIGADIVMGTDPDGDRVGLAVRTESGEIRLLTGNQVGALLVDYLSKRDMEQEVESTRLPIVFKTIVTSDFGSEIAKKRGIAVEETLTGFKYIGDRINQYEREGSYRLLVGYEESYGYLVSPIVRDKDAVQTCLAIAEMAAYHKANGVTLADRLEQLYEEYGYFEEKLMSITLDGEDGVANMKRVLANLRSDPITVQGIHLLYVEDYLSQTRHYVNGDDADEPLLLPKADVQKFAFEGGHWVAIRPSGTEPKMKVYIGVRANQATDRERLLARIIAVVEERIRV